MANPDDELIPSSESPDEIVDFEDDLRRREASPRIVQFVWEVWGYVTLWWFTRRWSRMWQGLPAIAIAGLILLPSALTGYVNPVRLSARYQGAVNQAVLDEDAESADLYLRKVLQLNAIDSDMRYAMAFVAGKKGDQKRSEELLTELASTTDGHPRAHLWMAKQLADGKMEWPAETRTKILHHLQVAARVQPVIIEAHLLLGQIYSQSQEYDKAIRHFEYIAPQRPELHLSLGQIHLQRNDKVRSKIELQQAADYFRKRVAATPKETNHRVALALAYRLLDDFTKAKSTLLDGLKIDGSNATLREFLAAFYIDHFDATAKLGGDRDLGEQLGLLEAALVYAPSSPPALHRLAAISAAEGEAGDKARGRLKEVLASGRATATVHLILGIHALRTGDSKKAELHFDQGHALNPNVPELLNNFAWLLAHQDKPELDRALTLVNRALETMPDQPAIRETRGQIYVKLGRWREALADLEFALPKMSENRGLHASLARVYRELGDDEIAELHERLGKEQ